MSTAMKAGSDDEPARKGPLVGIRVLEFASIGPGPFCAMMLADLGAEVLRIDRPDASAPKPQQALLNRGRKSVTLDLKHALAVDIVLRLIDSADVLLEGMRPGVMERLGIGPLGGGVFGGVRRRSLGRVLRWILRQSVGGVFGKLGPGVVGNVARRVLGSALTVHPGEEVGAGGELGEEALRGVGRGEGARGLVGEG